MEEDLLNHPQTKEILEKFPQAIKITITHYKDVFCRSKQNYYLQKQSPSLILAQKKNQLIYEGAPVCQNFGNKHFYYTSCVMNCIYDCEYCYLQGMYPSANLVIFLNIEDVFLEVTKLLEKHPVYLCISYDTDLLALEGIFSFTRKWIEFTKSKPNLTIELRTKSANFASIRDLMPTDNVILAWTLSPELVQENYEHHTPSLKARLKAINEAISSGYRVRLCFDPILYISDFEAIYKEFITSIFQQIPYEQLFDVSIGVFRVSNDYLKRMRKQRLTSAVIQYPYEQTNGVSHYGHKKSNAMINYVKHLICNYISEEKIFCWNDDGGNDL